MSLLSVFSNDQIQVPQLTVPGGVAHLRRRLFELLERAEEGDHLSLMLDLFLVSLIVLSTVAIVLESVSSIFTAYAGAIFWFEVITISVFSIEYLLRIWCCVESAPAGVSHIAYRLKYMFTAAALIDLAAILPFYLMLGGLVMWGDMRFLRMFRLLRVFKLTRYSAAFDILAQSLKENIRSLAAAFFILLMVMLVAATGMYYFEHEAQPEVFSSIPASMWWAFATLTTVGYGDITPITVGGKMFGALITVLGLGMVALPTGILASAYTEQLRRRSERYRRHADHALQDGVLSELELHELEELRETLGLDKNIAREILGYEKNSSYTPDSSHCCPHCGRPVE